MTMRVTRAWAGAAKARTQADAASASDGTGLRLPDAWKGMWDLLDVRGRAPHVQPRRSRMTRLSRLSQWSRAGGGDGAVGAHRRRRDGNALRTAHALIARSRRAARPVL